MNVNLSERNNLLKVERLLRADEVADLLNLSSSYVYKLMKLNQIPTVRIGGSCRIHPQDLLAFIEQNRLPQADNR
jgi:excisionase family DNA binding protein